MKKILIIVLSLIVVLTASIFAKAEYHNSNYYKLKVWKTIYKNPSAKDKALNPFCDFYGVKTDIKTNKNWFVSICEKIFDRG